MIKLSKKQLSDYELVDGKHNTKNNYAKIVNNILVDKEFYYNKDLNICYVDDEELSDKYITKLLKDIKKTGLKVDDKKMLEKAITRKCKLNTISPSKELAKEQAKAAKEQAKADRLNNIKTYINEHYGNRLRLSNNNLVYFDDKPISTATKDEIRNYCRQLPFCSSVTSSAIDAIINTIAGCNKKYRPEINANNIQANEDNWQDYLTYDKQGNLEHTSNNYLLIFNYTPEFKDKLTFDEVIKQSYVNNDNCEFGDLGILPINDMILSCLRNTMANNYFGGKINISMFNEAYSQILLKHRFDPVKQMFLDIEAEGWDSVPRLHNVMKYYFGDTGKYSGEKFEVMMCGAVQRILEVTPSDGVKFDYMAIFFGPQGNGKTHFIERLFFSDKYVLKVTKDIQNLKDKDFVSSLNISLCVQFDELAGLLKSSKEAIKSMVTDTCDTVRLPYDRLAQTFPRRVTLWGNTNENGVFKDEGYERRFLCFETHYNKEHSANWWAENYTPYIIKQLWAEAIHIYRQKWEGKIIEITPECLEDNKEIQNRHKMYMNESEFMLQMDSILYSKYPQKYYHKSNWISFKKTVEGILNGCKYDYSEQNIFNIKWLDAIINRPKHWIIGYAEANGWKIEEVNHPYLGKGTFIIKPNCNINDIIFEVNKIETAKQNEKCLLYKD